MPLLQILGRECRTRLSGRVWPMRWHLDPFAVLTVDGSQILRRQLISTDCNGVLPDVLATFTAACPRRVFGKQDRHATDPTPDQA
jgi:hypothetical protein